MIIPSSSRPVLFPVSTTSMMLSKSVGMAVALVVAAAVWHCRLATNAPLADMLGPTGSQTSTTTCCCCCPYQQQYSKLVAAALVDTWHSAAAAAFGSNHRRRRHQQQQHQVRPAVAIAVAAAD